MRLHHDGPAGQRRDRRRAEARLDEAAHEVDAVAGEDEDGVGLSEARDVKVEGDDEAHPAGDVRGDEDLVPSVAEVREARDEDEEPAVRRRGISKGALKEDSESGSDARGDGAYEPASVDWLLDVERRHEEEEERV